MYIEWYRSLKKERENATYFSKYIENKYRYLSERNPIDIKKLLKLNNNFSDIIDRDFPSGATVVVHDNTAGVFSWLLSLVHDDLKVISVIKDPDMLKIAMSTPGQLPARLTFTSKQPIENTSHITINTQ